MTLHSNVFEDGRDLRYFHRVWLARWYVPFDNENCNVIGWRMFGPSIEGPFEGGDRDRCGYDDVDFLEGQTGNRPYEVSQRAPGDWDVTVSQRPIAVHALENPMRSDVGVAMNRRNLRRAVRGENPHTESAAIHARANAGQHLRTYTNNTVLAIPLQKGRDDDEFVREVCKNVIDLIIDGDQYEGDERNTFIQNALKDCERSFAAAAAAE